MKNKFIFIISLVFIIFSISTIAEVFRFENFDYCADMYDTRDWEIIHTSSNFSHYPILSSNTGSCAFGINATSTGATGSYTTGRIRQNPSAESWTSGIIKISFTLETGNTTLSSADSNMIEIDLLNDTQNLLFLEFTHNTINMTRAYSSTNFERFCGITITRPYYIDVQWKINLNSYTTSLLIINKNTGAIITECLDQYFKNMTYGSNTVIAPINMYQLYQSIETGRTNELFLDDFLIEVANFSTTTINLPVNSYCDEDTNCLTNYCIYNKCQYKGNTVSCSSSSECLSGSCINSHCTTPDVKSQLDNFWTGSGIVSTGSKILIGFLIIVISIVAVALVTGGNIPIASVVGLVSLFAVVYIGLFPIWIVVLIIIICAIGFFSFFSGNR